MFAPDLCNSKINKLEEIIAQSKIHAYIDFKFTTIKHLVIPNTIKKNKKHKDIMIQMRFLKFTWAHNLLISILFNFLTVSN